MRPSLLVNCIAGHMMLGRFAFAIKKCPSHDSSFLPITRETAKLFSEIAPAHGVIRSVIACWTGLSIH